MKYFIVGLDFDGVLAHGLNVKKKYAKEWFGLELSLGQTKETGFNALVRSLGRDISYRSLMDRVIEEHSMEYEVPSDCIPVLKQLYDRHCRFFVITSRNQQEYSRAMEFVCERFSGLIKTVCHTNNQPKDVLIKRLNVEAYVDDDISKLLPLVGLPAELVYYRQPENVGQEVPDVLKPRILEASSFVDVGRIVEGLLPKTL